MGISKLQGLWVACNPHKFEIPTLWFPYKPPVNPCKHLQCNWHDIYWCSTLTLVFGCWELGHRIFIMMRTKKLATKLIHKMTTKYLFCYYCSGSIFYEFVFIFTQSGPRLWFWVKILVIFWICSALKAVLSFSAWEKSCQKLYRANVGPLCFWGRIKYFKVSGFSFPLPSYFYIWSIRYFTIETFWG